MLINTSDKDDSKNLISNQDISNHKSECPDILGNTEQEGNLYENDNPFKCDYE